MCNCFNVCLQFRCRQQANMRHDVHGPPRGSTLSPDLNAKLTCCAGLAFPAHVRATAVPSKRAFQLRQMHGRCPGKFQPFIVAPQNLVAGPYHVVCARHCALLQYDKPTTARSWQLLQLRRLHQHPVQLAKLLCLWATPCQASQRFATAAVAKTVAVSCSFMHSMMKTRVTPAWHVCISYNVNLHLA